MLIRINHLEDKFIQLRSFLAELQILNRTCKFTTQNAFNLVTDGHMDIALLHVQQLKYILIQDASIFQQIQRKRLLGLYLTRKGNMLIKPLEV